MNPTSYFIKYPSFCQFLDIIKLNFSSNHWQQQLYASPLDPIKIANTAKEYFLKETKKVSELESNENHFLAGYCVFINEDDYQSIISLLDILSNTSNWDVNRKIMLKKSNIAIESDIISDVLKDYKDYFSFLLKSTTPP